MTIKSENKKIAVFDDDEDILAICEFILGQHGWEVHSFSTCNGIIETLLELRPAVIFMDNWIPDVGGIEATRVIKQVSELKHIPVIFFSANSDVAGLARKAGAETYLSKPFDLDELAIVTKTALNI